MRKIFASAALAALLTTASGFAGAAPSAAEAQTGIGKWRWNATDSHYATGAYATEQTMTITRNDPSGIAVSQTVTLKDGKTFNWSIDSPYDDTMRPASDWMSFAFKRLSDHQFHDRYKMKADGMMGAETFTITPNRITIRGASLEKGKKMHYVEIWDRVE